MIKESCWRMEFKLWPLVIGGLGGRVMGKIHCPVGEGKSFPPPIMFLWAGGRALNWAREKRENSFLWLKLGFMVNWAEQN